MVPVTNIVAFSVAFLLTTILPIALSLVLIIKKKISGIPFLVGAGAFFVSQVLIRIPLLNILLPRFEWYQHFSALILPFIIMLALTAGLFEESARLIGVKLLKNQRTYKDIISFGLGHGMCEAILIVGSTHLNNLYFSLALNSGNQQVLGLLPAETMAVVCQQLVNVSILSVYAGVLERVAAVAFHVFATLLVFKGVILGQQWRYFIAAILAHAVFNMAPIWILQITGPLVTVAFLLLIGLGLGLYVGKQRTNLRLRQTALPPTFFKNLPQTQPTYDFSWLN